MVQSVRITLVELQGLKNFFATQRLDWEGIYSCNSKKDLWHSDHFGYTSVEDRQFVRKNNELPDRIVDLYLHFRKRGSRFFISEQGVFCREFEPPKQFISWIKAFR